MLDKFLKGDKISFKIQKKKHKLFRMSFSPTSNTYIFKKHLKTPMETMGRGHFLIIQFIFYLKKLTQKTEYETGIGVYGKMQRIYQGK